MTEKLLTGTLSLNTTNQPFSRDGIKSLNDFLVIYIYNLLTKTESGYSVCPSNMFTLSILNEELGKQKKKKVLFFRLPRPFQMGVGVPGSSN